jgi:hypothetical protein
MVTATPVIQSSPVSEYVPKELLISDAVISPCVIETIAPETFAPF